MYYNNNQGPQPSEVRSYVEVSRVNYYLETLEITSLKPTSEMLRKFNEPRNKKKTRKINMTPLPSPLDSKLFG